MTSTGSPPRLRRPWSQRDRAVPRVVVRPLQDFLRWEASGGLLLLVATAVALVWANVALGSYEDLWSTELRVQLGDWTFEQDLLHVVNDGLMTLFFLVIGLEVKRELAVGELRTRRAAMLPVFAAAGAMLVPALVYAAVTSGGSGASGWGIPMATDTAFALGVLALIGRRAPPMLTTLLLAVAVIDDLGAMTVMTVFYSDGPDTAWIVACIVCLVAVAALNRLHVRHIGPYLMLGALAWIAAAASGVHPTVVGVALGLLTPARPFQPSRAVAKEAGAVADAVVGVTPAAAPVDAGSWRRLAHLSREAISPVNRIEHALHPWTSMLVVPLFALANAGNRARLGLDRRRGRQRRDARDHPRPGGRQARGDGGRRLPRRAPRAVAHAAGRRLAAPGGPGRHRRHRLHHLAVHHEPGVHRPRGDLVREGRHPRRIAAVGRRRRRAHPPGAPPRAGDASPGRG